MIFFKCDQSRKYAVKITDFAFRENVRKKVNNFRNNFRENAKTKIFVSILSSVCDFNR
jgi:hypothetical protein